MARRQRARPGARQNKTGVWYGHNLVGTLVKAADGGIGFSYAPTWLSNEEAFPVASILPLVQGAQRGDLVFAALDNLLPDADGELRAKIAERVAAPDKDVFSLLSVLGRDCVGALQFLPQGAAPEAQDMAYRVMTEDEMADLEAASGAEFDQMFLTMMIEHHEGAIEMAKTEQSEGEFPEAVDMAKEIETTQAEEIQTMQDLLKS